MSLINEALKKAQRQRTDVPDAGAGDVTAGGRPVQRRATPMRAQTMILIAAAAITLVVCSVVATVYLLTRKPAEPVKAVAVTPAKLPAVDANAPSPVIVAPVIAAPVTVTPAVTDATASPTGNPGGAPSTDSRAASASKPASPQASKVAAVSTTTPSAPPAAAAAPASPSSKPKLPPDPRVLQFVDAIKVTGIRSSGDDSKVLMNDRVFRVNEIVERTLEVKLVKVASDALTFEDANGVIYTKTF